MGGEWQITTLGSICQFRAGVAFSPDLQGKVRGDYPFAKVSDMNLHKNGVKLQEANNWVSQQDLVQLKASPIPQGAIIFAKIGEALRQNRLRQLVRPTLIDNNMMAVVPNAELVDPTFLYYALSQFDFATIAQGTALPYLTVTALSALELAIPGRSTQRAIAELLGSLDDRIEQDRRTADTLGEMAGALFESWFTDFDPVLAKARGRLLGLPDSVASMFPDSFGEDGLPKGWSRCTLAPRLTRSIVRGIAPAYADGGMLVINQKCIRGGRVDLSKARYHDVGSRPVSREKQIEPGDIVINSTGVGTLGRVAQVRETPQPLTADSHVTIVKPNQEEISSNLLGLALMRLQPTIETLGRGSTGQTELARQAIEGLIVTMAPKDIRDAFDSIVAPLRERADLALREIQTLADLRDTLLPQLISGALSIEDVEQKVSVA